MHVAIIGAGPTGLFLGGALARRGHRVTAVDRDPGPGPDGEWPRRGVMQFHHAHGFRPQIVDALRAEIPAAHDRWLAEGAEPIEFTLPDGVTTRGSMRSRRETFERALRAVVVGTPGLTLRRGHVDAVVLDGPRARGLVVDGLVMAAAEVDPAIGPALAPYLGMVAGPDCLDAVEPRAAAVYRSGWRPARAPGPSRGELARAVRDAAYCR